VFDHQDDVVERIIRHLRQPVQIDPALDARVMQDVGALPVRRHVRPVPAALRWLTRPRHLALSPLGGLAIAAGIVILALLPARGWLLAPPTTGGRAATRQFQFVLLAPRAANIALVGDFNDWDTSRTPMRRSRGAVWTAVVPLSPGRYRYAFLLNGSQWIADPGAPAALDDVFGAPSSVVTVDGL
jgi:predicted carbohydrate-binding protein with CBM48